MDRFLPFLVRAGVAAAAAFAACAVALVLTVPTGWLQVLLTVTAVIFLPVVLVGAAVIESDRRNPVGWIFWMAGIALPLSTACGVPAEAAFGHGDGSIPIPAVLSIIGDLGAVLAVPLIGTFGVLLFPDGRLGGRRGLARVSIAALIGLSIWALFSPDLIDFSTVDNPIGAGGTIGGLIDALVIVILLMAPLTALTSRALLLRSRTTEDPALRKGIRLAARWSFAIPLAYLACAVAGLSTGATAPITAAENCAALAIGLASWVGIVRYGLFDTRTVVNRALVYGALTAALVGMYLTVSVVLGVYFDGVAPGVVATGAAALAVLPLRDVLQRRVNRMLYGLRDQPGAVFTQLGDRLEAAAALDDILPAAARTVADALRSPYVAIEVGGEVLAAAGRPTGGAEEIVALPFAGETIGRLLLETRGPGDRFGRADQTLLAGLARQIAVAARTVTLTTALQHSREHLVSAREEERRRLRRDLHDGLGPTLAGIALGIDTARRALPNGAGPATDEMLTGLRRETERAVAEIRRIAYDLRPPILDELGLCGALREQAARLGGAVVQFPPVVPVLPAAVEIAAYRIVVEALTNAARHAPGAPVTVSLAVGARVDVEIADEGLGIPDGFLAGVGITSMRERAVELGGDCTVGRRLPRGTLVRAHLPIGATP